MFASTYEQKIVMVQAMGGFSHAVDDDWFRVEGFRVEGCLGLRVCSRPWAASRMLLTMTGLGFRVEGLGCGFRVQG